jgi:DNA-binding PadR family transcriptional regulator
MHGYQVEQIIEERGMREWTEIGFSSIYYLLDKLKKKGWLTSSLEPSPGKGPVRQVFQLTASGRKTFKQSSLAVLEHPHRAYSNFHLGISNLPALEAEKVLSALGKHRAQLRERLENVQNKLDSYGNNLPWHVAQLFDLSLAQIRCELDWVTEFIDRYKTRQSEN